MKRLLLALLPGIIWCNCYGQKEGYVWYFGTNAGLDFNVNPPAIRTGAIDVTEGCSSIADPVTGQLVFYTDGITVFDRNHSPMAGELYGHASSTQSSVIVPQPGSNTLYYIFTTAAQAGIFGNAPAMCYSIADRSLNGGDGALTSLNNVILDSTTEKLAVVGSCDRSFYWIVGHRWNCDSFYAFKLSATGLSGPVESKTGSVHAQKPADLSNGTAVGYMKFSSDSKKLGLITTFTKKVELFDFNIHTGVVSNPITDTLPHPSPYGCSFSPDNSKFYVSFGTNTISSGIYQYDMRAGNPAAIIASRILLAKSPVNGIFVAAALQNGPNGKMYIASLEDSGRLHVIHNPNAKGAACNFEARAQALGTGNSIFGLPGMPENFLSPIIPGFGVPQPLDICLGDSLIAPQVVTDFTITPSTGLTISVDSTSITFKPSVTTTYTAIARSNCGPPDTARFTVYVHELVADFIFDPADPGPGDLQITLDNQTEHVQSCSWYDARNQFLSSSINYTTPHPGLGDFCYKLIVKDSIGCEDSVTKCVSITKYSIVFIPNAFSPNGDGINDEFRLYGPYRKLEEFSVFNRYGERIFYTNNRFKGWDGARKGKPCDAGTYHYLISFVNGDGEKEIRRGDVTLIR